jgi:hypothetical protein
MLPTTIVVIVAKVSFCAVDAVSVVSVIIAPRRARWASDVAHHPLCVVANLRHGIGAQIEASDRIEAGVNG